MAREKTRYFTPSGPKQEPADATEALMPSPSSPIKQEAPLFVDEDPDPDGCNSDRFAEFKEQIVSILGDIPEPILRKLFHKHQDREDLLTYAIDDYLAGVEDQKSTPKSYPPVVFHDTKERKRTRSETSGVVEKKIKPETPPASSPLKPQPSVKEQAQDFITHKWSKYLGTIYSEAWATRPYLRPLAYLQKLSVKSLNPKKLVGKEASRQKDSAIVRIYISSTGDDNDEREVGRLKEDLTRIIAPLMDLNLISFKACVMLETNKRLSIGDPFYIKIDCFAQDAAFCKTNMEHVNELGLFKKSSSSTKANFNFAAETDGEAKLRLRQYAISRLFDKLELKPLRSSTKEATQVKSEDVETDIVKLESGDEDEIDDSNAQEMNLDQLKVFYQENQQSSMLDFLPDTTKPPQTNFSLELRQYQRHGLSWMLAREKELTVLKCLSNEDASVFNTQSISELKTMEEGVMNPLWRQFKWPNTEEEDEGEPKLVDNFFYANLYSGEMSLEKPLIRSQLRGGILADEMGLGKTISALALINSVPYDLEANNETRYASKTTLIVVPMSLLSQWQAEFEKVNNNSSHTCIIHYGDQTVSDLSHSLINNKSKTPVIILTTYGTVLSEYTKLDRKRDSDGNLPKVGLYSVKFFRIILDEGHNIRNRTAKTSRAVFGLLASRKWILTGTPVINRLDDLYSLVKFLELEPWDNFSYWKTFITLPFEKKQIAHTLDVVKSILEPIFLRRTKDMKGPDGKALVTLPPKEVTIEKVNFNERELMFYDWFRERASKTFKESLNKGELLRKYAQILTHILRLRQICCHVSLVNAPGSDMDEEFESNVSNDIDQVEDISGNEEKFKNETEANTVLYSLMPKINPESSECSICTTNPIAFSELVVTECAHTFCHTCILEHIGFQAKNHQASQCPNCRSPISRYKLFKVSNRETHKNEYKFHTGKTVNKSFSFKLYLYDPDKTSSKIQALINHLNNYKSQGVNDAIIVFSQFSSFLDLIQSELKLQIDDIKCLKFDGRLKMNEREELLKEFNESANNPKQFTVLLLSLKAGGVGLNLTSASTAFMMDPWWSPSIEDQAIDRLHRIGQTKHVKVVRFIMENSIETKMLKIQARKKQIGEAVGIEEEEKRRRRIEEIKILFED